MNRDTPFVGLDATSTVFSDLRRKTYAVFSRSPNEQRHHRSMRGGSEFSYGRILRCKSSSAKLGQSGGRFRENLASSAADISTNLSSGHPAHRKNRVYSPAAANATIHGASTRISSTCCGCKTYINGVYRDQTALAGRKEAAFYAAGSLANIPRTYTTETKSLTHARAQRCRTAESYRTSLHRSNSSDRHLECRSCRGCYDRHQTTSRPNRGICFRRDDQGKTIASMVGQGLTASLNSSSDRSALSLVPFLGLR